MAEPAFKGGGLPGGVLIASRDGVGVKVFSAKEVEAAVRHGVVLEAAQVLLLV